MKSIKFIILLSTFFLSVSFTNFEVVEKDKVSILLIGDSTTIGGKGIFETTIEKIINKNTNTPSVEVINSARGGETAHSVIESGRYEEQIKPLGEMDYIFVRYGINDYFKRKPFEKNFPKDYKKLIRQLREDFPSAKIILATIIPFFQDEAQTELVNNMIKDLAKEENLDLFDVYPAYKKGLETHGENAMNVRFVPLSNIPEVLQDVAVPYSSYVNWKETDMVRVLTTELDPIFGDVEGWYQDRHPNPMGYRLLAIETVNYILPMLEENPNSLPLSKNIEGEFIDEVYKLDAPKEIKAGSEVKVTVSYSAKKQRDIKVLIQMNKEPWETIFVHRESIEKGTETKEFTLLVPEDVELGSNYKIVVDILPVGKGWPDRLDEKFINNVNIVD